MLAPPRPRGVIRAAYQTHSDLIGGDVAFMLDLGDGTVLALPAPSPWRRPPGAGATVPAPFTAPEEPLEDALDAIAHADLDAIAEDDFDAMRRSAEIDLLREGLIEHADADTRAVAAEAQLHTERQRAEALQAHAQALESQAQELHVAIAGLTEVIEHEGVHASVLADIVRAETERREQSDSRALTLQAHVTRLESRLEQLVGELAFAGAAREDAERTAAELLAQAERADKESR